ncbi:energy transducer TonB [Sphingopyxis sp.]|uniref:energy transducer TonB n=1 Tax=Sphingopyxis sp. TaxID=1908224 RepID=UPI003D810D09
MLLDISASGAVTGCKVDEGSGHADLDGAACDLMRQHGKFSAALDAAGNPGAGRYSGRFTWSLPVEPEPADAESDEIASALADLPGRRPKLGDMVPAASNLVLEVNADGTIKRCQFDATTADKTKEAPASPCAMFESLAPFAPILDDRGEAIGQRFEIRSTLSPQAPTAAP